MRLNVYSEEITGEVQLIVKDDVIGADGQLTTFYGLRVFLASPDDLHRTEHDDDRSAVTFWCHDDGTDPARLRRLFDTAAGLLSHPQLTGGHRQGTPLCTGMTATWCPTHGDCTCGRDPEHGDFTEGQCDPACPLHGPTSSHAEPVGQRRQRTEDAAGNLTEGRPAGLWDPQ